MFDASVRRARLHCVLLVYCCAPSCLSHMVLLLPPFAHIFHLIDPPNRACESTLHPLPLCA